MPITTIAPVVDGKLDDPAWRQATQAGDFWNSLQSQWPAEQTEVLVTSDGKQLFIAFKVFDSQPDRIEAMQTRRDNDLGLDDQVAVVLDPFLSYRAMSTYRVNAIGTQRDELGAGRARQLAWKGDWKAVTTRTEFGWVAEIAIPFEILNFPPDASAMGVNFLRYHHRTGQWSSWANLTVRNLPEEMGRLNNLHPAPQVSSGTWTFLPYILGGRNIANRGGQVKSNLVDSGIDIRYAPRSDLTGLLSIRPDFSQIETSITDIDFRYNEKFRTDPRPFFQEGSSYFGDDQAYFYSNRIPNFDYGIKGFGNAGANRFGALLTRSSNDRTDAVVTLNHQFDATHTAGAMAVTSDRPGLRNQLYALKGRGRSANGLEYGFDAAATRNGTLDRSGSFSKARLGWGLAYWSVGATADRYSRGFEPANGLLARDLPDTAGYNVYASYYRDRAEGLLREVTADLSFEERDTADGRVQRRRSYAAASIELREQQIRVGMGYFAGPYRPVGAAAGLWSNTVNDDRSWNGSIDFNTRSSRWGYGLAAASGFLGGGDYRYTSAYGWAKPSATTITNLTTEKLQNFGTFNQTVFSAGWDITPEHVVSGRVIDASFGRAYRLAYTWRARRNTDFFLVWDRTSGQATRLSAKIVMTL